MDRPADATTNNFVPAKERDSRLSTMKQIHIYFIVSTLKYSGKTPISLLYAKIFNNKITFLRIAAHPLKTLCMISGSLWDLFLKFSMPHQ